jgi:hypothetical protein
LQPAGLLGANEGVQIREGDPHPVDLRRARVGRGVSVARTAGIAMRARGIPALGRRRRGLNIRSPTLTHDSACT